MAEGEKFLLRRPEESWRVLSRMAKEARYYDTSAGVRVIAFFGRCRDREVEADS